MISCPKCDGPLPVEFCNAANFQPCPNCGRPARVETFRAFFAPQAVGSSGEALVTGEESSCFYHPAKRAVTVCESCGRFLCGLCDIDLNGQHLCSACVNSGRRKGKLKQLENRRMLYDSLALWLALVPLLIFYLTILTAPAAIYVVLRHWNAPRSIVGRSRWRMVVAMIIALAQIGGWIAGIYYFTHHRRATRTTYHSSGSVYYNGQFHSQ